MTAAQLLNLDVGWGGLGRKLLSAEQSNEPVVHGATAADRYLYVKWNVKLLCFELGAIYTS